MNKRDLELLKLGKENPQAIDLLIKLSDFLEQYSPVMIKTRTLAKSAKLTMKATENALESIKGLLSVEIVGDYCIVSDKELSWTEEDEFEVVRPYFFRPKEDDNQDNAKEAN